MNISERMILKQSVRASVSASSDLAAALGADIDAAAVAVVINNTTSTALHVNPQGTASASNGAIASQSITIFGHKQTLDKVEIYAPSSISVDLFVYASKA